jgi:hypothetical protein
MSARAGNERNPDGQAVGAVLARGLFLIAQPA